MPGVLHFVEFRRNLVTQHLVKEIPGSKQGTRSSPGSQAPRLTSPPNTTQSQQKNILSHNRMKPEVMGIWGDSVGPNLLKGLKFSKLELGDIRQEGKQRKTGDFPDGPVAKTPFSQRRGALVQSLVREVDPTCCS